MTDTLGYTTRSTYDLLGRRMSSTDALGHSTGSGYDAVGNRVVMTDTLGYVTRSTYDLTSRRIAVDRRAQPDHLVWLRRRGQPERDHKYPWFCSPSSAMMPPIAVSPLPIH